MKPEKREIALASVLGLFAGPCYLFAGPGRFLTWYALISGGGIFSTTHWLKNVIAAVSWLVVALMMGIG